MQQPIDKLLIKKYLKGECSSEERELIRGLMKSGDAQQLFDEVLNEGWTDDVEEADSKQLKKWQRKFKEKVNTNNDGNPPAIRSFSYLKYAAVLALFLTIGGYAWLKHKNAQTEMPVAMQQTENPGGELIKIKLSDSTVVTLNAASKLKYPAAFRGKTREVYLEGEAFFAVAHDKEHPFIVHTSKIKVNVLGTSFNVRSYPQDKEISVAVETGKVGVLANMPGSKTFMLLSGDKLAYSITNEGQVLSKTNPEEIDAWQSGMLIYHNETLENISRQLERWYNVKVVFRRDATRQLRFNLKQKNDRLENVMQTLKFAGGIKYSISGDKVTIW